MVDEELRKIVENYRPNSQTVEAMRHVSLLATMGPSASGKTTIMEALALTDPAFHYVVGETSRQPRTSERNGVDFSFRSRTEILEELQQGKLIQIVIGPNGDLYCTRAENFSATQTNLFPLMPDGVKQFRALPLKFFSVAFIVPASFELWQSWLNKQSQAGGWTEDKWHGRLAEAKSSFEFAFFSEGIRFVLNDTTEQAIRRLQKLASGQPLDDEETAHEIAIANYRHLMEL